MAEVSSTPVATQPSPKGGRGGNRAAGSGLNPGGGRGPFEMYKPEQGKWTRGGTFACLLALIAWGAYFLYQRLQGFEGESAISLLVVYGIPLTWLAGLGALAWWLSYNKQTSSDFMIATEGEMKKVSWSSRREVVGSTKVVIIITLMMSAFLFFVDVVFQALFAWIGVLK